MNSTDLLGLFLPIFVAMDPLGILPTFVIGWMDILAVRLVGGRLSTTAGQYGWMWLTPIARERASYSGFNVCIWILGVVLIVLILVWLLGGMHGGL